MCSIGLKAVIFATVLVVVKRSGLEVVLSSNTVVLATGTYDLEDVAVIVLLPLGSRSADETVQFVSESEWFMQ